MTLEILTSESLGKIRHGFFTRRGGASSGIYAGLNCGLGSSDQSEAVAMNRARVAEAMDVPPEQLLTLHQVHSADVVIAETTPLGARPPADGWVSAEKGLALGVLTADCAPVLFADQANGVIGAAHAGWRGALGGITDATLDAMEKLGASRDKVVAVVGPAISQSSYEVGQEFLETFLDEDPDHAQYFTNGFGDKYLFDLPGYVLMRLRRAGVQEASWIGACTYSDPERFYSYRRSTHQKIPDYGRLISAIVL